MIDFLARLAVEYQRDPVGTTVGLVGSLLAFCILAFSTGFAIGAMR